jgi:hypothetical protein
LKVAIAALPILSGSLCVTAPVRGSTRETLTVKLPAFPPPLPSHNAPSPAAMSVGTWRVRNLPVTA